MLDAMSSGRGNHLRRNRSRQPKRCDVRAKNPIKIGRTASASRAPLLSRLGDGERRVGASPRGAAAATHGLQAMRERALAEAPRLGGGRFTLDRPRVVAVLRSARGDRVWEAKAKAMLDAQEQAEADRDSGQALSVVRDLRARAIAGWSGRALVQAPHPVRGSRPERFRPHALRSDRLGGRSDHSHRQVAAESLPGARPPRGNNDGESPGPQLAGQASRRRSRYGDN
jgi:hypothetical protein